MPDRPRILGVLLALAGESNLSTYLKILGVVAEASLLLWLIMRGVDVQRWRELATTHR